MAKQPANETLQEYASSTGLKLKVDREAGVIPGVKILGLESKNGRTYTPECAAKAMSLYEGAAVFVDHQKPGTSRSYHDRIGHLANITAKPDGLFADFHMNPRHAIAEQVFWDAENAPSHVGFSHDCEGRVVKKDGKAIVEEIVSVASVDLVAKPATTKGLYESDDLPDDPEQRELCEHGLSAVADARLILLGQESIETKKARLCEVLSVWTAELTGSTTNKETSTMEWKDITEAELRKNRADLVEVLTGTDATSKLTKELTEAKEALKAANNKLAEADAEKAKQAKTLAIAEELKAAKLDASDKVAVSESFMETLNAAPDEAARKRLIEDRKAIVGRHAPLSGAAPFAPVGDIGTPAKNKADLLSRL